jgi:hypothetical protein
MAKETSVLGRPGKTLVWVLSAVAGLSLAAGALIWSHGPAPGSAEMELLKALLQVGLIAVGTTLLAVLASRYQLSQQQDAAARERQRKVDDEALERRHQATLRNEELLRKRQEYRYELLKTTLDDATRGYSAIKKARRLLRARGRKQSDRAILLTAVYDAEMDTINNGQLVFENLQRAVDNVRIAFSEPDAIIGHLRSIDSYLSKLITEYENERPDFAADESRKPLSDLARMLEFLAPTEWVKAQPGATYSFLTNVVHAFHEVQRLIRIDLLNPHLNVAASASGKSARKDGKLSNSDVEADVALADARGHAA